MQGASVKFISISEPGLHSADQENGAGVSKIPTEYKHSRTNHSLWREQDEYVTVNNSLIWAVQLEW